MSNRPEYWIETSLYDLEVAKALYKKKHYIYTAYLCHLSTEKMLKAVYADIKKKIPPKIHNLIVLSERAGIKEELSKEQLIFLARLDPVNIEARYPEYKENMRKFFTKKQTRELLENVEEILKWLRKKMS